MFVDVFKKPLAENDSYLIKLIKMDLDDKKISDLMRNDEYLSLKFFRFMNKNISKDGFEGFDKPSLKNLKKMVKLNSSIYTFAVNERNNMDYDTTLEGLKYMLENGSRRAVIRFLNPFNEYFISENLMAVDVSCLAYIQYMKDQASIIFRASDIKHELFVDIITLYRFFIKTVYLEPINIEIFASTAQNYSYMDEFLKKMEGL